VNIGFATRYGALCFNDEGETAGAIVMMLKGANSSEVIKNVKDRIAQIQKTLPEGVIIEPFLDRTKMVNNAIGTVEKNLVEGALIVIFILVIFLGNVRAGLLVASVIPLAMLFAIIMMNLFGVSGNLMSLGALDFGLIVDGAVIIVEAVMHQLSHSKLFANQNKISQAEMDKQVGFSAGKMMNSAVFGQVIILIVYLPILSLSGIEGKMFTPMAQTVAFALVGAFILSLTFPFTNHDHSKSRHHWRRHHGQRHCTSMCCGGNSRGDGGHFRSGSGQRHCHSVGQLRPLVEKRKNHGSRQGGSTLQNSRQYSVRRLDERRFGH
jgi:cobalt-zinc-cadmium resistance protein CzcA